MADKPDVGTGHIPRTLSAASVGAVVCPATSVLFLDIDGVLNSTEWVRGLNLAQIQAIEELIERRARQWIDSATLRRLERILDATGATIVLSSTWRLFGLEHVNAVLARAGFNRPITYLTGRRPDSHRGREIGEWLLEIGYNVERFVILDDDSFDISDTWPRQFVHTSGEVGLTDEAASRAVRLMAEQRPLGRLVA